VAALGVARRAHPRSAPRRKICVCVATVLIAGIPTSLIGGPAGSPVPETASATVALADLDLKTSAGLRDARRRLGTAVQHLCQSFMDSRIVSARETYQDCVHDALQDAEQRLRAMVAESKSVTHDTT
jgi:UrcA family protein